MFTCAPIYRRGEQQVGGPGQFPLGGGGIRYLVEDTLDIHLLISKSFRLSVEFCIDKVAQLTALDCGERHSSNPALTASAVVLFNLKDRKASLYGPPFLNMLNQ